MIDWYYNISSLLTCAHKRIEMSKMSRTEQVKLWIKEAKHIVFFGGAGVSVPSGIPDFRSSKGVYAQKGVGGYSPEQMVSHSFLMHHTKAFFKFYFEHLVYEDAKPNIVHVWLSTLEKEHQLDAVVTQNIDGLHQMAGSQQVIELHGSVHRNYCVRCGKQYSLEQLDQTGIPTCTCGGMIRPDVVLYEESLDPNTIEQAVHAIEHADLLIIGGTSLSVYPAASFVRYYQGKHIIVMNKGQMNDILFGSYDIIHLDGDIAQSVNALID